MKLSLSKNKEPVIKRKTSVPPREPMERRSVTPGYHGSTFLVLNNRSFLQQRRRIAKNS